MPANDWVTDGTDAAGVTGIGSTVVLAGVDGGAASLRAASFASGMARREGAVLVVAHVISPAATTRSGKQQRNRARLGGTRGDIGLLLQISDEAAHAAVPLALLIAEGDPYRQLSALADHVHADLVVVGASPSGWPHRRRSPTSQLIEAGRWPVVVVP